MRLPEWLSDVLYDLLIDSYLLAFWEWFRKKDGIQFGWVYWFIFRRRYTARGKNYKKHFEVTGVTETGKSSFLGSNFVQHVTAGRPAAVVDPHGDLARGCLRSLYDQGWFHRPDVKPKPEEKLLYINFANRFNRFLPWNVLNRPAVEPHKLARDIVKAFKRAWPQLDNGFAPQFDDVMFYSVYTLIVNKLPLTKIRKLLTVANKPYRDSLLRDVDDEEVVAFFHERYENWGRDASLMIESSLNKVSNITKVPELRYTFGQQDNTLDFRRIMDQGISCIFNLAGLDDDTQRLIGTFIAIGFEQAALSREDILDKRLREDYYLTLDEFHMFFDTDAKTINNILALAAKYGLRLTIAYQTLSQLPVGTQGAIQNTIPIKFKEGHQDAKVSAEAIGTHDPVDPKHIVEDELARRRIHPSFKSPTESYGEWTKSIKYQHMRNAYIHAHNRTEKIKTLKVTHSEESLEMLPKMEEYYAIKLMTKKEHVQEEAPQSTDASRSRELAAQPAPQPPALFGRRES